MNILIETLALIVLFVLRLGVPIAVTVAIVGAAPARRPLAGGG